MKLANEVSINETRPGPDQDIGRHMIDQLKKIVDIRPTDGTDTHTEDNELSRTPEYLQSGRVLSYATRLAIHIAKAQDGQSSEEKAWATVLKTVLDGPLRKDSRQVTMPDQTLALIVSKLSGIPIPEDKILDCLDGNRKCAGIAVWDAEKGLCEPVSRDESEIAQDFIDHGKTELLVNRLDRFQSLGQEIADQLITNHLNLVATNIKSFSDPDYNKIAHRINDRATLSFCLPNFKHLDNAIADVLIKFGTNGIRIVGSNLASFENPDQVFSLLGPKLVNDPDLANDIVDNIYKAGEIDSDKLATILMSCAHNYSTAQKIKSMDLAKFKLDKKAVDSLLAFIETVNEVKKENPYEEISGSIDYVTLTKPGTKLHKMAVEISKNLRESSSDTSSPYQALRLLIEEKWALLVAAHTTNPGLFGNDKKNITDNMFPTYRRLVADYIVLKLTEANPDKEIKSSDIVTILSDTKQVEKFLGRTLDVVNLKFTETLDTDVPYYDKLFAEWDAKRLGQKDFQEVFIGRDGVYAYIGRRAQIQARRRFLGLKSDDYELKMPTYLVYPRAFLGYLSNDSKLVYLKHNIPNPESAHYFDTGFTGTIPQDIMRVLGVSEADWDRHIRLLSANNRKRMVLRLKGDNDQRYDLVHYVESNAKNEKSASGLFRDTDGTLKPYAQPNSSEERLSYALVQQALHRHYYTKELIGLYGSENLIAMNSQTLQGGELRVSTALNEKQTEEIKTFFDTDNIGHRLLAESKQIKINDPNDPYPNEAVFEVPLSGTDGVIVKSVPLDKQLGPIDEFEALILLQNLNIDAPRPLGRLFSNGQHGFIIMQKLPGISGRVIKDYLDNEVPDPEEQRVLLLTAKTKMTEISETINRDTGLDKSWRLKDFMIVFGRDNKGEHIIERMLPINFERTKVFDPKNPSSIELGQDLDRIVV